MNNDKIKEQAIKNEIVKILRDKEYKNNTGMVIEGVITTILEKYIHEMKKTYFRNYYVRGEKHRFSFDGFIPEGIDSDGIETAVEIKILSQGKPGTLLIESYIERFEKYSDEVKKLLLVIVSTDAIIDKSRYENSVRNIKVKIWDIDDLVPIFLKYDGLFYDWINKFEEQQVNQIIREEINNDKNTFLKELSEDIEVYIDDLKEKINAEKLVLFLGAGVSRGAALPLWNDLLKGIYRKYVDNCISELKKNKTDIQEQSSITDPLVLAEFLKLWKDNNDEQFKMDIHEVMYAEEKEEGSLLIDSLCQLIKANEDKINAIVTYNFDDLLERFLFKHGIENKSVCNLHEMEELEKSKTGIAIYHVHGIIPKVFDKNKKSGPIIFSEKEYYDSSMDFYKESNIIQLNYLMRNTCLFIGMSMTDPNLKRLLISASKQRYDKSECKHYVIMREEGLKKSEDLNKRVVMRLKKELYKGYNVNLIQVPDYGNIPHVLKRLY